MLLAIHLFAILALTAAWASIRCGADIVRVYHNALGDADRACDRYRMERDEYRRVALQLAGR